MKNLLKYFLLFLFFLLILSNTLFSQTTNSLNSQLNHFQVIFPALISAGFIGLESILQFIYAAGINSDPVVYDLLDLSLFFAVLPMYFHDFSLGLIFSGISIGFYILEEKLHQIQEYFIEQLPLTGYMEFSFYSTYAIYREGRIKAKSGIYDLNWREKAFGNSEWFELFPYTKKTKWEPYSFWDLAISPILLENLSDLLILTMIPAGFFSPFLQQLIAGNKFEQSIFNTGKAYIGNHELPILVGVPLMAGFLYIFCSLVAIGEEGFFRGFIYEELGSRTNEWIAKITDMIIFPLFHVPGEIEFYQENPEYFLNYFIRRSSLTFIIDVTYDRGGLARSVSFHFWVDFTQLLAYYIIYGGVAHENFMDILGMYYNKVEIQIAFSF